MKIGAIHYCGKLSHCQLKMAIIYQPSDTQHMRIFSQIDRCCQYRDALIYGKNFSSPLYCDGMEEERGRPSYFFLERWSIWSSSSRMMMLQQCQLGSQIRLAADAPSELTTKLRLALSICTQELSREDDDQLGSSSNQPNVRLPSFGLTTRGQHCGFSRAENYYREETQKNLEDPDD